MLDSKILPVEKIGGAYLEANVRTGYEEEFKVALIGIRQMTEEVGRE